MAKWLCDRNALDWDRHVCSVCGQHPITMPKYIDEYDDEYHYCGQRECGIEELLTPHCPWCGSMTKNVERIITQKMEYNALSEFFMEFDWSIQEFLDEEFDNGDAYTDDDV